MKDDFLSIKIILLLTTTVLGGCGVIYELLISTVASYLLGNSILQFSLTIGTFMFSFSIGSILSKLIKRNLLDAFIYIETFIGIFGGISAFSLFWIYGNANSLYIFVMYSFIVVIGILIGMEIPVLSRYLNKFEKKLRITIANTLGFDYLGALIGSISFSLFLLPKLGIISVAFLIGLFNIFVVIINLFQFSKHLKFIKSHIIITAVVSLVLFTGIIKSRDIETYINQILYEDKVIYSAQTPYQKITMTQSKNEFRLFLDGNLQFCSKDEYRYHESIVHIPMLYTPYRKRVLVLGGGDGLVLRELLKYPDIEEIHLVDIDSIMVDLCRTNTEITKLNKYSLESDKVHIYYQDAFNYLENDTLYYDLIISDLPDPNNESLAKLYSIQNYLQIKKRLRETGTFVSQSTSPFFAPKAYWGIGKTIEEAGFFVLPYHTEVPSFGDWGFWLAVKNKLRVPENVELKIETEFLQNDLIPYLFIFPKDIKIETDNLKASTLNNPVILDYYRESWRNW